MGKILVLYHSNSGRTEKMAQLVAAGACEIEQMNVRLKSIREANAEDLFWCNGIALGSPTNLGTIAWEMKCWWDKISGETWSRIDGKIGCAFSSSGSWGGGTELTCQALSTVMMNFGFLVFGVTDYVDKQMAPHYGSVCAGEPQSEGEKESCRRLGLRLAQWVAVFCDGRKNHHPIATEQLS